MLKKSILLLILSYVLISLNLSFAQEDNAFPALTGVPLAKHSEDTDLFPSVMFARPPISSGKSLEWGYYFPGSDMIHFVNNKNGNYDITGGKIGITKKTDTSRIPVYWNGYGSLPDEIINSDSAFENFKGFDEDFQQWISSRSSPEVVHYLFFAGYPKPELREITFNPELPPGWFFIAIDTTTGERLLFWCSFDGNATGMSRGPGGIYFFTAREGFPTAQNKIQTNKQPSFIMPLGNIDTLGKSNNWVYVFPNDNDVSVFRTFALTQSEFFAVNEPELDSSILEFIFSDFPVYFKANGFSDDWYDSDFAMEQIRNNQTYKEFMQNYNVFESIFFGGRINNNGAALTGEPVGTPFWFLLGTTTYPINNGPFILCWCSLEPTTGQVPGVTTGCLSVVSSAAEPNAVDISLAPNPAQNTLLVKIPNDQEIKNFKVFNLLGSQVPIEATISGSVANVNVETLPVGSYIIFVQTTSGVSQKLFNVIR